MTSNETNMMIGLALMPKRLLLVLAWFFMAGFLWFTWLVTTHELGSDGTKPTAWTLPIGLLFIAFQAWLTREIVLAWRSPEVKGRSIADDVVDQVRRPRTVMQVVQQRPAAPAFPPPAVPEAPTVPVVPVQADAPKPPFPLPPWRQDTVVTEDHGFYVVKDKRRFR